MKNKNYSHITGVSGGKQQFPNVNSSGLETEKYCIEKNTD